jgi:hypothetical protein
MGNGQHHDLAALPPGKIRYPLHRRLAGPQSRCERVRKISPLKGFDPRTMHPIASRYTDYSILGQLKYVKCKINPHFMWRLSSYVPQNSVPTLERPGGKCCIGKQWLFILRITRNTWIHLDVWQHTVLSVIKRTELKLRQNDFLKNK